MNRSVLPYGKPARTFGVILVLGMLLPVAAVLFECGGGLPAADPVVPPPDVEVEAGPGTVAGVVRFADGTPAAGAAVDVKTGASGESGGTARAAADGSFRVEGLGPDGAALEVEARLGPLRRSLTGDELQGSQAEGVVAWVSLPATFTISGVVLSAADHEPIPAALVLCAGRRVASLADGAFVLRGLPAAAARDLPLIVEVEAEGFSARREQLPAEWLPGRYSDVQVLLERAR